MSPMPLHHKTLPVGFVRSWLLAVEAWFGRSGTQSLIVFSAHDFYPSAASTREWGTLAATLTPLYGYVSVTDPRERPVDYRFLTLMRSKLSEYLGDTKGKGTPQVALMIGRNWWCVEPALIRNAWLEYDLQHVLGRTIVEAIARCARTQREERTPEKFFVQPLQMQRWKHERIRAVFHAFAATLESTSGIVTRIGDVPDGLILQFPECPFCLNEIHNCNILLGLVQSMVLWLYGHYAPRVTQTENLPTTWILDHTQNTIDIQVVEGDSHRIHILLKPDEA